MFANSVRIACAFFLFAWGTYAMSNGRPYGVLWIVGGFYWLFLYVRSGPVWLAFKAYQRGQIDRARELIGSISRPQWLSRKWQTYYRWIEGAVASSDGRWDDAANALETALRGRHLSDNDRSVINAMLAEAQLERGDRGAARRHLERARVIEHRPENDTAYDELEARLSRT